MSANQKAHGPKRKHRLPTVAPEDHKPFKVPDEFSDILSIDDRLFLGAYQDGGTLDSIGHRWGALRGVSYKTDAKAAIAAGAKLKRLRAKLREEKDAETFWELMGLGVNKMTRVLSEGMDATLTKPLLARRTRVMTYDKADGTTATKFVQDDELVEPTYADHPTRISAAMAAAKLRGEIAQPRREDDMGDGPVTIVVNIRNFAQINHGGNGSGNGSRYKTVEVPVCPAPPAN